jgi:PhnB protein
MATKKRSKPRKARPSRKPAVRKAARKPARRKVEAVPKAYGSITAALSIRGAADAIAFYAKAFGAKEVSRMPGPDGKLLHAEIRIGDRRVMLGDEAPEMGAPSPQTLNGSPVALMHYVKDVDAVYARAVAAGAKPVMPPADMFWGDRYAQVLDPFGHRWSLATHTADLTDAQMAKGFEEWMAKAGAPPG